MTGRRTHVRFPFGRYLHPVGDDFVAVEIASGIVLLVAAAVALIFANTWSRTYSDLWTSDLTLGAGALRVTYDLRHWVNDGLMTVFFFVVGLEIKRELVEGELRDRRTAALPVLAAVGGMVLPAVIFLAWNPSGPATRGWGITMATDLAFALAVLALVAPRAPTGLKLFLLTLAVVDDTGSVVVITLFYSGGLMARWLLAALGVLAVLVVMPHLGARQPVLYVPVALALWLCTVKAGLSAALIGVALGLLTPARAPGERRVVHELEGRLHLAASFVVIPVFAIANAGVDLGADNLRAAGSSRVTWGIIVARVVGKAAGIALTTTLALRLGLGRLPNSVKGHHILGVGALAGIGFTVALFIADVSYRGSRLAAAQLGILAALLVAAACGATILTWTRRRTT